MLGDRNPSVVCGLFSTEKGFKEFMKGVDNRKGMRVREIRFVDIGIPLNEDFNDNLNFLKAGSNPILARLIKMNLPFGIKEKLLEKLGLKAFDYSKQWKSDNKNPMLFAGLTPLAVDDKYSKGDDSYTEEEKEMCSRLSTWETPNYKAKEIGVFDE